MSTQTTPTPAPSTRRARRARRALRKLDNYTLRTFNPAPPLTYPTSRDQL